MTDNRFECDCERGGNCTKTTMCALQNAVQGMEYEIRRLTFVEKNHLQGIAGLEKQNEQQAQRIADLEKEIERLRTALKEIAEAKGRYDMDPLIHAENIIEDMMGLALAALAESEK